MSRRTEHTPGPWSDDASDYPMIVNGPNADTQIICIIEDPDRPTAATSSWFEQNQANARLIAAAPDHAMVLRAIARGVLRWETFSSGGDCGELCFAGMRYSTRLDEFGCPRLTEALRSAIAKAMGR